ncbi:MAG: inosine/xanthosine triphosphatase [Promethearchaeota archaeon]|nr:MAG: inosine/xanthosine triphosphatase [Candidatus Lokiarchaeota archaeon]
MTLLKICVGSLNPTKITATQRAYGQFYQNFEVVKHKVNSGVPDQPIGLEVILEGAKTRAKNALQTFLENSTKTEGPEEYYGVGIEAGLVKVPHVSSNYMDFQFCAIIDEQDHYTFGSGIGFEYPKGVIEKVFKEKKEIGEIMGNLSNNKHLKTEEGAIGFLSQNAIKRTDILMHAVICALLPRINTSLYNE